MRKDIWREEQRENINGKEQVYYRHDPKTWEIAAKKIVPGSLKLEQGDDGIYRAKATTTEGRTVLWRDWLSRQDLSKLRGGSEELLPHFIEASGHMIVDENALLRGPSLWRRGRNLEEVRIETKAEQSKKIGRRMISRQFDRECQRAEYDFWYLLGVWEVENEDGSLDPGVAETIEKRRLSVVK